VNATALDRNDQPIVDHTGQCGGCEHWSEQIGDPMFGKCWKNREMTDRSDGCKYWVINEDLRVP
jgi:hypothetical protein